MVTALETTIASMGFQIFATKAAFAVATAKVNLLHYADLVTASVAVATTAVIRSVTILASTAVVGGLKIILSRSIAALVISNSILQKAISLRAPAVAFFRTLCRRAAFKDITSSSTTEFEEQ